MPFSVLSFFVGILFLQQWADLPSAFLLLIVVILVVLSLYFSYKRIAYFLLGFLWASIVALNYSNQRLSPELQGKELLVQGEVVGLTSVNKRRVRFDFKVSKASVALPDKLRLSWYYPKTEIKPGQQWQFWLKLKQPHGTFNPAAFDYEKWLYAKNIGATGYIRKAELARLLSAETHKKSIDYFRYQLLKRLDALGISSESLALIKALIIGDKSHISSTQWQVMAKSGTNHLMAISGLHIGLIAAMIYAVVFRLWLRFPVSLYSAPQVAAVMSWIAAVLYAALAGFSIPTQRALIMLSLVVLTVLLQRQAKPLNILAVALLLVLCIDPLAVLSIGFYLSFLAVFYILYVFSARLGLEGAWRGAIKLHLLMAVALLPVLFYFFQSASLIAPLANIVAVPVVSFILLPASLLALLLLFIWPSSGILLFALVDSIFQYLWGYLSYLTSTTFASIIMPQADISIVLLAMLGLLIVLAPKGVPAKLLGLVLILPLFFGRIDKPEHGEVRMTLLDVGQGLATVVETQNYSLLFDAGARFSNEMDMGRNVVLPFLHFRYIKVLDKVIISHADNDHIGGAKAILSTINANEILSSVPEQLNPYSAISCIAGQEWLWDGVLFKMLSPPTSLFNDENNNSCVLKISTAHGSILLTGDIEKDAEATLVKIYPDELQSKVLVAPHHGSKTSSTLSFLSAVRPEIILIPAGAPNRFGFPHKAVLERYEKIQAEHLITGNEGAITVELLAEGVTMDRYRELAGSYWNKRVE